MVSLIISRDLKGEFLMDSFIYGLIFIVLCVFFIIFKPQIKGWFGEKAVSSILAMLNKDEYKVINDVMLNTEHGTSQIDHVVLSLYGIFVIETKNYKGWITGSEFSEQWTKNMYGTKYKFRNPILQNYGHIKALEKHLGLQKDDFIPIVVFSVDAEIKVKAKTSVIYTVNLNREIKKYREQKFTHQEVERFTNKLLALNVSSRESKKEHVASIKTQISDKKENIKNRICPRCGGQLIERKGKYGTFMGCSNYPKCRYTINE